MSAPWTRAQMIFSLEEFSEHYANRPIKDNSGGMKAPHAWASWFVLRHLWPEVIIESGVLKGQGTYFFERACPADLYCIEPDLKRIEYRSREALYTKEDFSTLDASRFPKERTVCFFDDHQDAIDRVFQAKAKRFRHLLFEDNYPMGQGDCRSLKQAYQADTIEGDYLRNVLEVYEELPPVFQTELTRWGTLWKDIPTPEPLLTTVEQPWQQVYLDEAKDYTWLCYVRLKG